MTQRVPRWDDSGDGPTKTRPAKPIPKSQDPTQQTSPNPIAEAVVVAVDSDTSPTVATVAINNDLPLQTGFAIPASLGVTFKEAPATFVSPPTGVAYYDNRTTLKGGAFCYVDTVNRKIISIEQGNSTSAPADPSSLFRYIKHDGAFNTSGNFQNPAPIDNTQLLVGSLGITPNIMASGTFANSTTGSGTTDFSNSAFTVDSVGTTTSKWLVAIILVASVSGQNEWSAVGQVSPNGSGTYSGVWGGIGSGTNKFDLGIVYEDLAGKLSNVASPVAWQGVIPNQLNDALAKLPPSAPTFTGGSATYTGTSPNQYNLALTLTGSTPPYGAAGVSVGIAPHPSSGPSTLLGKFAISSSNQYPVSFSSLPDGTQTYDIWATYVDANGNPGTYVNAFTSSAFTAPPAGAGGSMPAGTNASATFVSNPVLDGHNVPYIVGINFTIPTAQTTATWLRNIKLVYQPRNITYLAATASSGATTVTVNWNYSGSYTNFAVAPGDVLTFRDAATGLSETKTVSSVGTPTTGPMPTNTITLTAGLTNSYGLVTSVTGKIGNNWIDAGKLPANSGGSYYGMWAAMPYSSLAIQLEDYTGGLSGVSPVLLDINSYRYTTSGPSQASSITPNVTSTGSLSYNNVGNSAYDALETVGFDFLGSSNNSWLRAIEFLVSTNNTSTTLNGATSASATSIVLTSAANCNINDQLTIDTGANKECALVVGVSGTTITLASGLKLAHSNGASVTINTWKHYGYESVNPSGSYNLSWISLGAGNVYQLGVRYIDNVGGVSFSVNVGQTSANPLQYSAMPNAVTTALAANGNLLASDFPGQTAHQTTGAYAGWEQFLTVPIYDSRAYNLGTVAGSDWLWTEWYVINTASINSAASGCGPIFKDNAGNTLRLNLYNNTGDVLYNSTTIGHPSSNPFWNTTATPLPHTVRCGITPSSGSQVRLVCYVDNVKVHDGIFNAPFVANGPITPGFSADSAPIMYVRSYEVASGTYPYDQMSSAVTQIVDINGNGQQVDLRNAYEAAPGSAFGGYVGCNPTAVSGGVVSWEKSGVVNDLSKGPLVFQMTGRNGATAQEFSLVLLADAHTGAADPTNAYLVQVNNAGNLYIYKGGSGGYTSVASLASVGDAGVATDHLLTVIAWQVGSATVIAAQFDGNKWLTWADTSSPRTTGYFGVRQGIVGGITYLRDLSVSQGQAAMDAIIGRPQKKNAVVNGNNWFGSGNIPPAGLGWTLSYSGGSVASSGTYGLNGAVFNCFLVTGSPSGCGVAQDVPVVAGKQYTYAALVYGGAGAQARLWIGDAAYGTQFNASPSAALGSPGPFYSGASTMLPAAMTGTVSSAQWQMIYGTFTIPNNYSTARVLMQNIGSASSSAYFLGVMIIEGNVLQDYVDQEPNASYGASSAPLQLNGTLLAAVASAGFTYTSSSGASNGTSQVNIYWDGTHGSSIVAIHYPYQPVGTTTNAASGSYSSLANLQPSTNYYYALRLNMLSNVIEPRQQTGGATADANDHAWLNQDGYLALAVNMQTSTPALNTGAGGGSPPPSGGGGKATCPATYQLMQTTRGLIRADEIVPGDFVVGADGKPKQVFGSQSEPGNIIHVTVSYGDEEEEFAVEETHLWMRPDGKWVDTRSRLHIGSLLQGIDGGIYPVTKLEWKGLGSFQKLRVQEQAMVMGRVIGHNIITQ